MESIYNLIPREAASQGKTAQYASIHAGTVREAASKTKTSGALFGPPGASKPNPKNFTKKGAGDSIRANVTAKNTGSKGSYSQTVLAPATQPRLDPATLGYVPRVTERGTIAPRSKKNFIAENAKSAVKASPKRTQNMSQALKSSPGPAGNIPKYLTVRKEAATQEAAMAATLQMESTQDPSLKRLSNDERQELLSGLKANYKELYSHYLLLSVVIDTIQKRNEKNDMEAKLAELEADIGKLERTSEIFVQV